MVRLTARSPVINELAKELALHLAPMGHELVGIHIWSEVNVTADAFEQGRVNEGHCLQSCVHSRREVLSPRGVSEWICLKTLRGTHCDLSGKRVPCGESLQGGNSCVLVLRRGPVAPRRSLLNLSEGAQSSRSCRHVVSLPPVRFSGMGWILGAEIRQPRQS